MSEEKLTKKGVSKRLNKWGKMRYEYLRDYKPHLYKDMTPDELLNHLLSLQERVETVRKRLFQHLLTEDRELKQVRGINPQEYYKLLNMGILQIEEVIKHDMIYV